MFGIPITSNERGRAAFERGVPSSKSPFGKGDRWFNWRQGWRRAELDAIIKEKGTCAGHHCDTDINGQIHDIGMEGWVALDPGSSSAVLGWGPVQCQTCGEIYSFDLVGYDREHYMEDSRKPELGHSFPKAATRCEKCGLQDEHAKDTLCPNMRDEDILKQWLEASWDVGQAERTLAYCIKRFDKFNITLSFRSCPNRVATARSCEPTCRMCKGVGTIGSK